MGKSVAEKPHLLLETPIASIAGIGPTRARQLVGLNVQTLRDLLDYFPRDYIQESPERQISDLKGGEIQSARGTVIAVDFIPGQRPRFVATLSDGHAQLWMTFFYGGYLKGRIVPGMLLRARGKVQFFGGDARMINPKWEIIKPEAEAMTDSIYRPVYPATAGLPSLAIERLIKEHLDAVAVQKTEWSAAKVLRKRKLITLPEAYRAIHNPKSEKEALAARRRLVYNEFMLLQIGLGLSRRMEQAPAPAPVF
jgi:ATP-dependent DNA helicase RecG